MGFEKMWLEYSKVEQSISLNSTIEFKDVFIQISNLDECERRIIKTAAKELKTAIKAILDIDLTIYESKENLEVNEKKGVYICIGLDLKVEDQYRLSEKDNNIMIEGSNGRGILYGVFHIIRFLQTGKTLKGIHIEEKPDNPIRIFNHWDNMDGSIERGYSGKSFFFNNHEIFINERTEMYARLIASSGINATVINNVNVKDSATELISERYYNKLEKLSEVFADYGVKLYISLNFAATVELGGLKTADPLDATVIAWWEEKIKEVYRHLPNLGGFVVKADSEGRPGPFTYNRNQAEGANMLGKIIKPYGGTVIWRCFVYNCEQDWRDYKTDRARAAYDYFAPLDGEFLDNVVLQIKNGPMDFQVREPVTPLLGKLERTNQILEVQIAQEYTGQQRHVCYLIPMFKEVLDFKTKCNSSQDSVSDIVSGRTYGQVKCGIAAVCNTGDDVNWTGHDLAGANLYGFGRLSYNTSLSAEEIAIEWIQMTFGLEEKIGTILLDILMKSRDTYEKYTSPLGIGWMVQPDHHYGPSVDGYEYSRWGTYHRADHLGIGVDRSHSGTGYAQQYNELNANMYNNIETCPEELLLFFHHLKYSHVLSTGKTLIQHIYDTHFEGVEEVKAMNEKFISLKGLIEPTAYERILCRLEEQLESAKEWRDQVNTYFYRKSGVQDEKGRKIY
ncbi:MAG TPA: alpha-glucuronidase [Epulopiscium sp.]|nr:alpha-glucuronidase [Candidatus Epulonipiscium sp.]